MKKYLSSAIAIAIICTFVSCGKSANCLSEIGCFDGKFIWEHQLDYVKEHNSVADNPLKLIKYKYVKPIDGPFDAFFYLNSNFSDKAYFGFESMRTDCNFEVFQKKDFVKKYPYDAKMALDRIKKEVGERFVAINYTHIVEITWEYQGKQFTTRALVANDEKGVLYDNIATVIPNPRPNDNVEWKRYIKQVDLLEDGHNSSLNNIKDKLTFKTFEIANHHPSMNYVGRYKWEYAIACKSRFLTKDGVYFGMHVGFYKHSELGYECDAQISSISGVATESKHHTFGWKTYNRVTPQVIVICDKGLNIGSSGEQKLGQEIHCIGEPQMAVK